MPGPGTRLHNAVKAWTGEGITTTCSCKKVIKEMDRRGVEWCRQNVNKIVKVLLKEARARSKQWKADPVDKQGNVLDKIKRAAWRGGYMVLGEGLILRAFVRRMVDRAVSEAEHGG